MVDGLLHVVSSQLSPLHASNAPCSSLLLSLLSLSPAGVVIAAGGQPDAAGEQDDQAEDNAEAPVSGLEVEPEGR